MDISLTKKQKAFIDSTATEVLFGGAAGGGKSYAQLIDAFLYACKYPRSKQLILRRTFPELKMSLIRVSEQIYPKEIASYNQGDHTWKFRNGSVIDFGYSDSESDVTRYQSAEYDVIRFDELTHFTEYQYTYMLSRLRGATKYPRSMKSSTNPGHIGHSWVKERWIDVCKPYEVYTTENGSTRVFIPALVQDNSFLMEADPEYIRNLELLPEREKRMLLYGDWDVFEGRFFPEFSRDTHVIEPFPIPHEWRRVFTMDYGLDRLAAYWIALDYGGNAYVYREYCESNLIISDAAKDIVRYTGTDVVEDFMAPPDLWNRRQETGRSAAEIFALNGVPIRKASNNREQGWLDMKEWLKVCPNEFGGQTPTLRIFDNCRELIKCLGQVIADPKNPNDMANEPHELTHAPDAIRYFCAGRPYPTDKPIVKDEDDIDFDDELNSIFEEI